MDDMSNEYRLSTEMDFSDDGEEQSGEETLERWSDYKEGSAERAELMTFMASIVPASEIPDIMKAIDSMIATEKVYDEDAKG